MSTSIIAHFEQKAEEVSMRHSLYLLMAIEASRAQTGQPIVEVFLPPIHGPGPVRAFMQAQEVVDAIYAEIGVRVVWTHAHSRPPGCTKQPLHAQIVVALGSSEYFHNAEAMAFASPFTKRGPCVTLFVDRITSEIRNNPLHAGNVIGHVLAHEMGHILQGLARHAEDRVMKSTFSQHDLYQMWLREHLHFTEDGAEWILR